MQIPTISIDNILKESCPAVRLGVLLMKVNVAPSGESLLSKIAQRLGEQAASLSTENIALIPPLHDTRQMYKALGKDPSRYRPSAEALLRRVVNGKGLYQVNNVVDALNLVSVTSGFSIGGYDYEKIKGNIRLGRGAAGEPYQAIGRGELNIDGLPVLRDNEGAFGSPTSDSPKTMVTPQAKIFLAVIFDFGANDGLQKTLSELEEYLVAHANGETLDRRLGQ